MPSIVKRGSSYRIFVSVRSAESGKPARKTATFHPPAGVTEKRARFLAESYAYQLEEQLKCFSELDDSCSLNTLCDWYFETIAARKLKDRTRLNNRALLSNYVLPVLGDVRLRDITPYMIDGLVQDLLQSGGLKAHRPLSPGTVRVIRAALSTVLSVAVNKGILRKNPVEGSTPPALVRKERIFLTDESSRELLEKLGAVKNEQIRRAIRLLLYTGLRRGELLALHWEDVDLQNGTLTVRYTLFCRKGIQMLTSPKSRASCRIIPIPEIICRDLQEQRTCIKRLKETAGSHWVETGTVFVNHLGGYMNGEFLNNSFKKFLAENGFPKMHIHDLRHANASILINRGVPMKIVSEHLGHMSEKTTEEFYTHVFRRSRQVTADVIEQALGQEESIQVEPLRFVSAR